MLKLTLLPLLIFACDGAILNPQHGYHMKIGVRRAMEIRAAEARGITRIIGGSKVSAASIIPHQAGIVALLTNGQSSICGGSVISNTRILTAAHCWWDGESQARRFTIVLGSLTIFTGGSRIDTSDVTAHPSWNVNDITNDIAIVRIPSVSYNNNIQAIPLPSLADVNQNFAGLSGTVSGWGKTTDAQVTFPTTTTLSQVTVSVITNAVCQKSFSFSLHGSHLCTSGQGRVGTCEGDSGGPLTVVLNNRRIQVGIVSFGLSDGCEAGLPSVYTRVTAFWKWISSQM